ncbi:MAG: IPT/TIG domain-containing protein [Bacteroidales bacterium]|nr:IPT/TIG domain-containing protein [Bacteroidales bacterium]MCB8999208.1 IPT/TIG domain-containing protein [Bacteroidales bacterium]
MSDINSSGVTLKGKLISNSSLKILDCGFLIESDLKNFKISLQEQNIDPEGFSYRVSSSLDSNVTYQCIAYIETISFLIIGNKVEFTSMGCKPPEIMDFFPKEGGLGSIVTLVGKNFSRFPEENYVYVDSIRAEIINSISDTIVFRIPNQVNDVKSIIEVRSGLEKNFSENYFKILLPEIESFSPESGRDSAIIQLKGRNFHPLYQFNKVLIGTHLASVISGNEDNLIFRVPPNSYRGPVPVSIQTEIKTITADKQFIVRRPQITDVSPMEAYPGETVKIRGNYLWCESENTEVYFDKSLADLVYYSDTLLEVAVPPYFNDERLVKVSVKAAFDLDVFDQLFKIKSDEYHQATWENKCQVPFYKSLRQPIVTYNGNAYTLDPTGRDLWKYSPLENSWSVEYNIPEESVYGAVQIIYEDKLFIFGSSSGNLLWEYDFINKAWSKRNIVPYNIKDAIFFTLGNLIYIVANDGKTLQFNPNTYEFAFLKNFPEANGKIASAFVYHNIGYVNLTGTTWQYDVNLDSWTKTGINNFSNDFYTPSTSFIIGDQVFTKSGEGEIFLYKYEKGIWSFYSPFDTYNISFILYSAFVIDNTAYLVANVDLDSGDSKSIIYTFTP